VLLLSSTLLGHINDFKTNLTLVQICLGVGLTVIGGETKKKEEEQINFMYALVAVFYGNLATAYRSVLFKMHFEKSLDKHFSLYSFYTNISFVSFFLFLPFYLIKKIFSNSSYSLLSMPSLKYLLIATSLNFAYNFLSFKILEQVSALTHSIINIMKRMYVVFGSMYILNTKLTHLQYVGVFISDIGCVLYAYFKSRNKSEVKTSERAKECSSRQKRIMKFCFILVLIFVCIFCFLYETFSEKASKTSVLSIEADLITIKQENRLICLNKIKAQITETMQEILPKPRNNQKINVFLFGVPEHINYGDTLIW
jgi:hypothetical protein